MQPSQDLLNENEKVNNDAKTKANEEAKLKYSETLYTLTRERIKLAGDVKRRPAEDLREEERIIVYRALIQQLLKDFNIDKLNAETQHLVAELIQSMFDVDKMLYFVAPDWWKPRRSARTPQALGLAEAARIVLAARCQPRIQ